jgi:hypothetical protein
MMDLRSIPQAPSPVTRPRFGTLIYKIDSGKSVQTIADALTADLGGNNLFRVASNELMNHQGHRSILCSPLLDPLLAGWLALKQQIKQEDILQISDTTQATRAYTDQEWGLIEKLTEIYLQLKGLKNLNG